MADQYIRYPNQSSSGGGGSSGVSSLNSLTGAVTIAGGGSISVTSSGSSTIQIIGSGGGTGTVSQIDTGAGLFGGPITTTGTISVASVSLLNQVVGSLPLAQTTGSISLINQVSGNLPATQISGSVSLVTQVTGNLPVTQTSGSVSLVNRVTGSLPLSQTSGSISATTQLSGTTPVTRGGTNSAAALGGNRYVISSAGAIVESSVAASGLATIALDNLASTAVNTTLAWGAGVNSLLKTANASGSTNTITVTSGDSANNNSGVATLTTGQAGNSASGSVVVTSGTGFTLSGDVLISSGGTGDQGPTGNVAISTNTTAAFDTGNITLTTGSCSATRGKIKLIDGSEGTTGHVWTSTASDGSGHWAASAAGGGSSGVTSNTYASNLGLAVSLTSNSYTIAIKQGDGTSNPAAGGGAVTLAFRNIGSSTGSFSTVSFTASKQIVIGSNSNFGGVASISQYLWIYALNDGGTGDIGLSGQAVFNDGTLNTTSTYVGGSNNGNALYSLASHSGLVSTRLIGRVKWKPNTAGVFDIAPTEVALLPVPQPAIGAATLYTPIATTFGTVASVNVFYSRSGSICSVKGTFVSGATAGTPAQLGLPPGLTISSITLTTSTAPQLTGQFICQGLGTTAQTGYQLMPAGQPYVNFAVQGNGNSPFAPANANSFANTGHIITFFFDVPVAGWSAYGPVD